MPLFRLYRRSQSEHVNLSNRSGFTGNFFRRPSLLFNMQSRNSLRTASSLVNEAIRDLLNIFR